MRYISILKYKKAFYKAYELVKSISKLIYQKFAAAPQFV